MNFSKDCFRDSLDQINFRTQVLSINQYIMYFKQTILHDPSNSYMSPQERKDTKEKILQMIAKSEVDIIDMEEMAKPISPENSIGRISRMDAINNKSVVESALRNKKQKLAKLKIALTKIDDENFGLCYQCKNPIQAARIVFMPESNLCVRCASRQ